LNYINIKKILVVVAISEGITISCFFTLALFFGRSKLLIMQIKNMNIYYPCIEIYIFCIEIKTIGMTFWTSGSNEGDFCNTLNVYSWCSLENTLLLPDYFTEAGSKVVWKNMTAKKPDVDRCLVLGLNKTDKEITGLEHETCNATNFYICEVLNLN